MALARGTLTGVSPFEPGVRVLGACSAETTLAGALGRCGIAAPVGPPAERARLPPGHASKIPKYCG